MMKMRKVWKRHYSTLGFLPLLLASVLSACESSQTGSAPVTRAIDLGDALLPPGAAAPQSCVIQAYPACNSQLLALSREFNVLVFQDFTAPSSDTQGRLVAGRDVSLAHYSVGDSLPHDPERIDLLAGRNLDFQGGDVPHGAILYGGTANLEQATAAGAIQRGSLFSFTAARIELLGVTSALAELPPTGTPQLEYTGERAFLLLDATRPGVNLVRLSASDLAKVHTLEVRGDASATIIVNVSGTQASMSQFAMFFSGGISRDRIIFNFHEATRLELEEISIEGTVLAPLADVIFPSGVLRGHLTAQNYTGAGQLNYDPFNGCLPVSGETKYSRDSFTDSTDSTGRVGGTVFEFHGMALKQLGSRIIVAVNANFPLAGHQQGSVNVGWGDFLMNFSPSLSAFSSHQSGKLFGVRFVQGTDSGVPSLGVYRDVTPKSVVTQNNGWAKYGDYTSYVTPRGTLGMGDIGPQNGYFASGAALPTSVQTGTLVADADFQVLTQAELLALGIDFPRAFNLNASQLGTQTVGFAFKRTFDMIGEFVGHIAPECTNDSVAIRTVLECAAP